MWRTNDYASSQIVDISRKIFPGIILIIKNVIQENGYQSYKVELCTEDGYYITLYRIQGDKNLNEEDDKTPVLLVHGFTASMAEFVMEKQQLGYVLADFGFDVWIANCRGTTYSRKHKTYEENSTEYWNYSFHEIGYYDLPTFIDYILDHTQNKKLHYIGVSQGCTVLSVLLSTKVEYNEKIQVAAFLCPALKFYHARFSLMKVFFHYGVPLLKWTTDYLHVPLRGDILSYLARVLGLEFSKYKLGRSMFGLMFSYFGGYRAGDSEKDIDIQLMCRTSPNTVSLKQMIHFSQIVREHRFTMYDYGNKRNKEVYKQEKPLPYDISKITAPIGLFYSVNDTCYGKEDMENLSHELGNCVYKYVVKNEKFNHFDFVYHKGVVDLLYTHVLDFMQKYVPDEKT